MEIESLRREGEQDAELAVKTFELLQDLPGLYVAAESRVKRKILELLLLNCVFDGVTLEPPWRKPFDAIAETAKSGFGIPNHMAIGQFYDEVAALDPTIKRMLKVA